MLRRIDRLLVATPSLERSVAAFRRCLDLVAGRQMDVPDVGAVSQALPLGDAWVQLLQPVADGPVARFLQEKGPGIYGLGIEVASLADARLRVEQSGLQAHPLHLQDQELVCLKREQLPGFTIWFSESGSGPEPADLTSPFLGVWQATSLVEDRDGGADAFERVLGRPARTERFRSDEFGYLGRTLSYGTPPHGDSIEVAQVHRAGSAMGRFWRKRGACLYMATLNTDDLRRVYQALSEHDVRHAPGQSAPDRVLYIHPSELEGCFLGVIAP